MQLWTDYEGVTIDGAFPLQKLLLPEGRSAFFSTAGLKGEPTVVRLIECHFDEEEILARWSCVNALNHPNFLKFEHYGQIELDGGPVVYAVFEQVDANLAEVLEQGHLSVKDVAQLTSSLSEALSMLHAHGFIHEHIEPRNIFAVGDVVKLRSDCIREVPEGEEGRAAKQRDVRDLAVLILQSLTQRRSIEGIPEFLIPPPFSQIVRKGLDGTWGLENFSAALEGRSTSTLPVAPRLPKATVPMPVAIEAPHVTQQTSSPAQQTLTAAKQLTLPDAQLPLPLVDNRKTEKRNGEDQEPKYIGATTHNGTWGEEETSVLHYRWLRAAAVCALLLIFSAWGLTHMWNAYKRNSALAATAAVSQPATQPTTQIAASPAPPTVAANQPSTGLSPAAAPHPGWRVISFTYGRKTDAEKKVASLALSHPELQPAVFTPSGHAPYLVSIGGVMDRESAYALARRSRSLDLPHDTYAQNYTH